MARQLFIVVLLLLGLGAIHAAGTRRPLAPELSEDPYAWLEPLPARIDNADIAGRWALLVHRMVQDAQAVEVRRFACRSPAEVGTLPMMENVARYVNDLPRSQDDEELAGGLANAAARGNWLARTLMLPALRGEEDTKMRYRAVQLAEWMYARRLGQLYSELEKDGLWSVGFGASGNDPSGFITAAAMQQDHVAQASIGSALAGSDDPELVRAGGRMLVCAAEARAFYRDIGSGNRVDVTAQVPGRMAEQRSVRR